MTTREYADRCPEKDFSRTDITHYFKIRMDEQLKKNEEPLPDETHFQSQLDEEVYPFLACFRAIRDTGYDEEFGLRYVEGIRK